MTNNESSTWHRAGIAQRVGWFFAFAVLLGFAGFGKRYHRADEQRYSLWSYTFDYNTFGTMQFSQAERDASS